MDRVAPAVRSRNMARVRGRDTKPELLVRRLLHRRGLRFRLQRRDLPGRPDIVLPGLRSVVFVHGCFWHGHDCPKGQRRPASNAAFWDAKLDRNVERDGVAIAALETAGWTVYVVWECDLARSAEEVATALEERRAQARSVPTR